MSSVTFSPSVGGDGSTVTDDSNATTGLDGGGHRTRFVPALAQVVAVAANTVTKAGEAAASAGAAASSASSAAAQVGLTTAAGAAQVALAAAHVATATAQATEALTQANNAATSASQASASATSAAASATSAGTAATAAATTLISAVTQRPALRPSLSVDWTLRPTAAALTAAGWTISRAGEMTYFGAVPVKVAENLFVRSADFGNASWTKSDVTIGAVTDESGLVGSTVVATAAASFHSVRMIMTSTNIGSANYRVRFLCKAAAYTKCIVGDLSQGRAAASFDLSAGATIGTGYGAGYISQSITPHELGGGLYWCELVMTSNAAGVAWSPSVIGYPDSGATLSPNGANYTGDGTSGIEVYAAQLQHNFDGDYVPTTDVPITQYANPLLTAAANELAYQNNSRGECVGLLQYPADTNLILQSQDLGNVVWAKTAVAVTPSKRMWAGYAPFWRVAKTSTAMFATCYQVVTTAIGAGSKYSATVALMADQWSNTTTCGLGLADSATTWGLNADSVATVISGPGVLVQSSGGAFNLTGLSTTVPTLIRITRTFPSADTAARIYIFPGTATSTLGAAILATRVHLSASPRYMPYIPTTTAAVTRGLQSITLGGSAFAAVNNPAEGTLLARASVEDLAWDVGRNLLTLKSDRAEVSVNRTALGTTGATSAIAAAHVRANVLEAADFAVGSIGTSPSAIAFSYSNNNFTPAMAGVAKATDTSGGVGYFENLRVGLDWAGLIQRTELYPRAMTSAELAAITTPGVLQ